MCHHLFIVANLSTSGLHTPNLPHPWVVTVCGSTLTLIIIKLINNKLIINKLITNKLIINKLIVNKRSTVNVRNT